MPAGVYNVRLPSVLIAHCCPRFSPPARAQLEIFETTPLAGGFVHGTPTLGPSNTPYYIEVGIPLSQCGPGHVCRKQCRLPLLAYVDVRGLRVERRGTQTHFLST